MNELFQIQSQWVRARCFKSDPLAIGVEMPDRPMRAERPFTPLFLLLAIVSLVAVLTPTSAAAELDSFEALAAWAKSKNWLDDNSNNGYKSDENNSFDISIHHDRGPTLTPFNESRKSAGRFWEAVTRTGKNITVAGGIPAYALYTSIVNHGGRDAEIWEYYCHDYRVLVRAHREASDGQAGSDPLALLENYIAFVNTYLNVKPPDDEDIDEDGIPLEVKVYAKGHTPASDHFLTDGVPSTISIYGMVKDQYGAPVAKATVFLVEKKVQVETDADGAYLLRASHTGTKPYTAAVNFVMIKGMSGLKAKLVNESEITANDKATEVVLEVSDENGPLRNKEVEIRDTIGFKKGAKEINYVATRNSNSVRSTTDGNGRLKFTLHHPDSVKELSPGVDSDSAFPVTGFLKVRVIEAESEATVSYAVESPFPKITGFATGRFLDAGLWQIEPSKITIEDRDSTTFKVTLEGPGAFKAQGDTTSQGTGHPRLLYQVVQGKEFRFHYRPLYRGFDLNNQPQVLKELGETAGTVYLSVLTNVGAEKMLDKAALFYPGKSFTRGMLFNNNGVVSTVYISGTIPLASDAAKNILSGAGHTSNVLNLGFKGCADQDEILKTMTGQGSDQDLMVTTDNAIGLTDTVLGITNKLTTMSGKLYWEALKASWELDKAAYKISKQYYDIAEAYQDVMPEEVTVVVEDETGRKTSSVGFFKVLVWKGGA